MQNLKTIAMTIVAGIALIGTSAYALKPGQIVTLWRDLEMNGAKKDYHISTATYFVARGEWSADFEQLKTKYPKEQICRVSVETNDYQDSVRRGNPGYPSVLKREHRFVVVSVGPRGVVAQLKSADTHRMEIGCGPDSVPSTYDAFEAQFGRPNLLIYDDKTFE